MADDHRAVYEALVEVHRNGTQAALATITATQGSIPRHAGSKMLIYGDGRTVGTVGGGAMEAKVVQSALVAMRDDKPHTETYALNNLQDGDPGICGGTATVFIEPIAVAPLLLVIGVGHVGKAVAELGKWMGYRVAVSDDRAEYATPDYLPGMDAYIVCPPSELLQHITPDAQTYIAALTRGLPVDVQLLPQLAASGARYIGLIGSRRRWAMTAKALREQGMSEALLARVHAPIGLELEAESPREIALSIMAEITMLRRGGSGQPMRYMPSGDE